MNEVQLARRDGWQTARQRLEEISNLDRYELGLYMGTFRFPLTREDAAMKMPQADLLTRRRRSYFEWRSRAWMRTCSTSISSCQLPRT